MTESVLLQFCKVKNNDDYCVICLRTSKERRLEKPKHLKKFMECISEPDSYINPNQLACYFCERQAAVAYHFRVALKTAAIAHSLKSKLHNSPQLKNPFLIALRYHNTGDQSLESSANNDMLECELRVRRMRARNQLSNTKILVIPPHSPDLSALQPGESNYDFVTPDYLAMHRERVNSTFDLKGEPDVNMKSIIIYEDDSIYLNNDEIDNETSTETYTDRTNPKPIRTELLLNPPASNQLPVSQNLSNFLLHPIVFKDGVMTLPSLTVNMDAQLVSLSPRSIVGLPQTTLQNTATANPASINTFNEVNTFQTPELFNYLSSSDNIQSNNVSAKSNGRTKNIQNLSAQTDPQTPSEPRLLQRLLGGPHSEVKAPHLSTDRIDWEDKIPMDVISFVNDEENTRKRPRHSDESSPTLGISNVTSLNEEYVNDVIDLC